MIKADFHLHTYHSDNQDRMTPFEYVQQAKELGFGALGFCDHHHNLTEDSWATLREEVDALQSPDLLLTTGYEATWMAGHLCVLDKAEFKAGTYAQCWPQTWSPDNLRILAHPDNNLCAWLLPLPVGVQGVEVINSGHDPYSLRSTSPCNGLNTYRRYLALDHPVAAIAQSDCHRRLTFGRVWTGVLPLAEGPFDRAAMHSALQAQRTIAVMGDLPVMCWCDGATEAQVGGRVDAAAGKTVLHWRVPPGTTVEVWLADRPLAEFGPSSRDAGQWTVKQNGPHWLLCRRGLAWAVTSPIWAEGREGMADAQANSMQPLLTHTSVQQASARVERLLDWSETLDAARRERHVEMAWPLDGYRAWAKRLLPRNWREDDVAWSGVGDPVDWAMLRLGAMEQMLRALTSDLVRTLAQDEQDNSGGSKATSPSHRVCIASANGAVPYGTYRFTVDLPPTWTDWQLVDEDEQPVTAVATPTSGVRDPLHGARRREQMNELIPWLARGEIHEYCFRQVQLEVTAQEVSLVAELWPAVLMSLDEPITTYGDEARRLAEALADPNKTSFYVHLQMPQRYDVALMLDEPSTASTYTLLAQSLMPSDQADEALIFEASEKTAASMVRLMGPDALAADPSTETLVMQFS